MTNNFTFDPADLPKVNPGPEYTLTDGRRNSIVQVGDMSFDSVDESDPDDAYNNALAWIAWYEYLVSAEEQAA